MRSVGLKMLKNKLSEYVRLAAGGETVLVTDRDLVVAEIGPPSPARAPILSDALLLDALRQGWINPRSEEYTTELQALPLIASLILPGSEHEEPHSRS